MGRDSPHTLVRAAGAGSHPQHFPWPNVTVEQTACTTEHSSPGLYQLSDENTGHRTQSLKEIEPELLPASRSQQTWILFTLQSFHCCVTSAKALPSLGLLCLPICKREEGQGLYQISFKTALAPRASRKGSAWNGDPSPNTFLPHRARLPPAAHQPMMPRTLPHCLVLDNHPE